MKTLQHLHIMIKAQVRDPKALSLHGLHNWAEAVVVNQDLVPVAGPFVTMIDDKGNEGPTGGVHIKTSHFAFHIWDNLGVIQADLYTCGELDVPAFINEFMLFEPTEITYMVMDRQDGFQILEAGTITEEHLDEMLGHEPQTLN